MFVSRQEAITASEKFANEFDFKVKYLLTGSITKKKNQKKVANVLPVRNDQNEVAMYMINYENGGFVILPADKRAKPIFAFSETNETITDIEEPKSFGFELWIQQNVAYIDSLRSSKKRKDNQNPGWSMLLNSTKNKPPPPDDDDCPTTIYVGPLLQTAWGQENGYNNDAPDMNCFIPTNERAFYRLRGDSYCAGNEISRIPNYLQLGHYA